MNGSTGARYVDTDAEPVAWDAALLVPEPDPGVPILLWHYFGGKSFDHHLGNPALDPVNDFLRHLILPPAVASV